MEKTAALIIDGAYFEIGVSFYSRKATIIPHWNKYNIATLINQIQLTSGHTIKTSKFITAETPSTLSYKTEFHQGLKTNGFDLDIRQFKKEKEQCSNCGKTYELTVQAEVDVAIAVSICKEIFCKDRPPVDAIILIAGDRDFKDAIKAAIEKKEIEIILIGYENTMSYELKSITGLRFLPTLNSILDKVFAMKPKKETVLPVEQKCSSSWDVFGIGSSLMDFLLEPKKPKASKKRVSQEKAKKIKK